MSCEISVAHAAPATPILKYIINTKSRIILITADRTRNTTGVLLSPTALIIPDTILYKNTVGIPANIITI